MILQWNKWAVFIVVMTYKLIFVNLGTVLTEQPMYIRGMRWHSWLRHCTTSREVAGSIPDGVVGIFH